MALSADASVSPTINKTILDVLTGEDTASFDFDVLDADGVVVDSATIAFSAGETEGSAVVSGLAPGTYTVHEVTDASSEWATQADRPWPSACRTVRARWPSTPPTRSGSASTRPRAAGGRPAGGLAGGAAGRATQDGHGHRRAPRLRAGPAVRRLGLRSTRRRQPLA